MRQSNEPSPGLMAMGTQTAAESEARSVLVRRVAR